MKRFLVPLVACPLVLGSVANFLKHSNVFRSETLSTGITIQVSSEITDAAIVEAVEGFMKKLVDEQKNLTDIADKVLLRNRWKLYE